MWFLLIALVFAGSTARANLIPNGDFAKGLDGWGALWTREAGVGHVTLADGDRARIEHGGSRDWSFDPDVRIDVETGDLFDIAATLRTEGDGDVSIGVVTYDAQGEVLEWSYGTRSLRGTAERRQLRSRFVVPDGVRAIHPRLTGDGPLTVWIDELALRKEGNVMAGREGKTPNDAMLENPYLTVIAHARDAMFTVQDKRTGRRWTQAAARPEIVVTRATERDGVLEWDLIHAPTALKLTARIVLAPDRPEMTLTLDGEGELTDPLNFPYPFVTAPGTRLIVPMNEGISYPVEDPSIDPMRLIAYGGHGISMAFWGVTDGESGQMGIFETADDAALRIIRYEGNLAAAPSWDSQKGRFGYARKLRYVFFDSGGYVAMAKRYREYAKAIGRFKTLAQKRDEIPAVDLLIGAVNVWNWDGDALRYVREMRALGIERILWSHREEPAVIRAMNDMGVLTSRYDIYQDVMNPANFPRLNGVHPDWPTEAWPDDLMLDENGEWRRGWRVKGKDGKWYATGVLCDRRAPDYARRRIAEELKTHPYRSRFIDTTTASPWRECYNPAHPMTRSESRYWKMELLRLVSEEMGLVTGSETGHDAAVPYVHYFEGMMSLGPYRVPDAGRNMIRPWSDVPERVAKFQLGDAYRLPLWELVYHDAVVATWYWGDYNNKLPSLWDKRDLFNILYGTPPMFMFNREIWEANKERFAQSYRDINGLVRRVGYAEMTDHRILSADRAVQQSEFSNGVTVTVNFSDRPSTLESGETIGPMSYRVDER